jgi:hypothetical protein
MISCVASEWVETKKKTDFMWINNHIQQLGSSAASRKTRSTRQSGWQLAIWGFQLGYGGLGSAVAAIANAGRILTEPPLETDQLTI